MKSLFPVMMISLIGCATFTLHVRGADEKSAKGVVGTWHGALITDYVGSPPLPLTHLRLIVKIRKETEGHYTGVLDSPDEGFTDEPLSDIKFKDNQFRFVLKLGFSPVFEGKYDPDKDEIKGRWTTNRKATPVNFCRSPVIRRPQEPVKPYPYIEQEVAYQNKKGKAHLAGTLTLPRTGGPFPVVLLITGAGRLDRDETHYSHKPFLVIGDYLTRRGIAVLRVDDRGAGGSTGDFLNATTANHAEDVLAGVEFLKSRQEIDPGQIGLIGHSEGATIATIVAARSKDVAFIVMLAGMGIPGDEACILKELATLKAMGQPKSVLDNQRALNEKVYAIVKQEKDAAVAKKKILKVLDEENAKIPLLLRVLQGNHKEKAEAQAKELTSPWWRYVLTFDPKPILMKVQCPVLALNGDKDTHATPRENLSGVEQALNAGGNKDYTIKQLPNLNHFFQTCKTGSIIEYAKIEETFAPSALKIMGDWILKRTTKQ